MLWHSAAVTIDSLCCETLALLKSVNYMTRQLSSCRPPRLNGPNSAPSAWIGSTKKLRRQGQAVQTFHDINMAIREYARVTGYKFDSLGLEPQISDIYTRSGDQKNCEIAFVVAGMAATGLVANKLAKWLCRRHSDLPASPTPTPQQPSVPASRCSPGYHPPCFRVEMFLAKVFPCQAVST